VRPVRTNRKTVEHEDVILFSVCGTTLAIRAGAVDEIRNLDGLTPFRASFAANLKKVTHTLVREKKDPEKTYFVVAGAAHFGLGSPSMSRVMVLRTGTAAVAVDAIDRMTQIALVHALPKAFSGQEREWYRGLAVCDGRVIPVVREEAFLSKGQLAMLAAHHSVAVAQGASA
jgi:chemotaxis signal transduction protein